jgi:hypothetical protein
MQPACVLTNTISASLICCSARSCAYRVAVPSWFPTPGVTQHDLMACIMWLQEAGLHIWIPRRVTVVLVLVCLCLRAFSSNNSQHAGM